MTLAQGLERFLAEAQGALATSVVSMRDGTTLVSVGSPAVEVNAIDAYLVEALRRQRRAAQRTGLSGEVQEIAFDCSAGVLLGRLLGDGEYLWTMWAAPESNAALARAWMRARAAEVAAALPQPMAGA